jgi:hypothetical protein
MAVVESSVVILTSVTLTQNSAVIYIHIFINMCMCMVSFTSIYPCVVMSTFGSLSSLPTPLHLHFFQYKLTKYIYIYIFKQQYRPLEEVSTWATGPLYCWKTHI